jgi:hypothetical protein
MAIHKSAGMNDLGGFADDGARSEICRSMVAIAHREQCEALRDARRSDCTGRNADRARRTGVSTMRAGTLGLARR